MLTRRSLVQAAAFTSAAPTPATLATLATLAALAPHATAAAPPPAAAAPTRDAPVPRSALLDDLALLDRIQRFAHPGLHRYQSEADWSAAVATLTGRWSQRDSQRLDDAYLALSALLAGIRCGHSYANFYNQRPAVQAALFAGRDKLPFTFVWLGERMVATGGALARGTEVIAIDGMPVRAVLERLLPFVRTDGHNEAKKRALLSANGRERWETFDIFFSLAFGARERFVVQTIGPDGGARRVELEAADLAARRAMGGAPAPTGPDAPAPWSLRFDAAGNAVLAMSSWAVFNSRWDWNGWLGRSLDEIAERRAPRLVVDLRDNEGGLDCGDPILARLVERPIAPVAVERRVRYRRLPEELGRVMDTWDDSFRDWGPRAQPPADGREGFFVLDGGANARPRVIEPLGRRLASKLVVLTSATNSSATFQFAQLVREHGLGTLVGGPTGGNQRGINGGAFFFVRLPATGLEVDLPLIGNFPQGPLPPDAGLAPDRPVTPSAADLAAGRDPVLDEALRV